MHLVCIFMNFNKNSSEEWKIMEKSRERTYKIAHILVDTCCRELNSVPI